MGLIIDNFAGGGGASTGIEAALGRPIDVAINHDPEAVAMHRINHPHTKHLCQSVWKAHPLDVTGGKPVDLAWFSPDCKHFSKAKGGKPVEKNIRDLAWVVVVWARQVKPRIIMLENVEEFQQWGPLIEKEGKLYPCPEQRGTEFIKWQSELKKCGYRIEWRELRACDYGAPTIRKRLFLIARCDGFPIVWPEKTHGDPKSEAVKSGKLKPWRTAAECIDWDLPCPSIFERTRPLAENTLKRIAKGIFRYVINSPAPFIVRIGQTGGNGAYSNSVDEPLRTVVSKNEHLLISPKVRPDYAEHNNGNIEYGCKSCGYIFKDDFATGAGTLAPAECPRCGEEERIKVLGPFLARVAHGEFDKKGKKRGRGQHRADEPLPTITASPEFVVCAPSLIQVGNGEREGQAPRAMDAQKPLGTVVASGVHQALVTPYLAGVGGRAGQSPERPVDKPYHTTTAKADTVLVSPVLVGAGGPERSGKPRPMDLPSKTLLARNHSHLVSAFLAQHNSEKNGGTKAGRSAEQPISTLTARGTQQQLVASSLVKLRGTCRDGQPVDKPMATVSAQGTHIGEVRAFLLKYYSSKEDGVDLKEPMHTVTAKDRLGLVTVHGQEYQIVDIGMRMLVPTELYAAQSFPPGYVINRGAFQDGEKALTKTAQVRMCGNSVPPAMSEALVRANFPAVEPMREAAE
jgi:DNA (cytosine-5)-methyltransferase 1